MPILALLIAAVTAGLFAGAITWRYPRPARPRLPVADTARKVGETIRRHPALRGALERRLDPGEATGLALTIALVFTVAAGIVLGLLAYLVRTNSDLNAIDKSVAKWGDRHATPASTHVLNGVTQLGSIYVIVALCVLLALVETKRTRNRWVVPFIIFVVGGEEIAQTAIKHIVDRTRPTFNPAAASLGPSFPSGHSATAAAFYAGAALLLGRRRSRLPRAVLSGLAVGIAVGVASSRVLLDVHWLTDVFGGLALGWAWFVICSIAFGGRILSFGAAVAIAEAAAEPAAAGKHTSGSARVRGAMSETAPDQR